MVETNAGLEIPIGITDKRALQAVARFVTRAETEFRKTEKAAAVANAGITRSFANMSRQSRGQIQNVGFQLQDIFVQISSGQGAARALGQQLPQLLGGFGALGGVLGLVAAAAIPLGAAFLGAGEGAGTLEERMDALNGAMRDYEAAIENASVTTAELVEKYGAATGAAQEFLAALVEISRVESFQALDAQMASLLSRFGDLAAVSADAVRGLQGPGAYADVIDQFNELKSGLDLSTEQALTLREAIVAVGTADGPAQQAEAAQELQSQMLAVLGPVEAMTAAQQAFYKEVVQSGDKAAQLVGDVGDVADAALDAAIQAGNFRDAIAQIDFTNPIAGAEDLSAVMGGLVGQAQTLLQQLNAAAQAARQNIQGAVANGNALDPLGAFNGGQSAAFAVQTGAGGTIRTPELPPIPEAGRSGGRSGGGRGRSGGGGRSGREETPFFEDIEKNIAALQRELELVGKSNEEIATAKARWELLDAAKKRGITVNETLNGQIEAQAAKVGQLTGELERAQISHEQFADGIGTIVDALFDAGNAGEDFVDRLKRALVDAGLQSALGSLKSSLTNLFSPQGGGGGGLFGGLFGGFRANGGPVQAGRAYVVGENSPELFVPQMNGSVLNPQQVQRAVGGSAAQDVNVTVSMDNNGNLQAFVDRRANQASGRMGQQVLAQVPTVMDNENKRRR